HVAVEFASEGLPADRRAGRAREVPVLRRRVRPGGLNTEPRTRALAAPHRRAAGPRPRGGRCRALDARDRAGAGGGGASLDRGLGRRPPGRAPARGRQRTRAVADRAQVVAVAGAGIEAARAVPARAGRHRARAVAHAGMAGLARVAWAVAAAALR